MYKTLMPPSKTQEPESRPKNVKLYIQEIGPFPQAAMITLLEKGAQRGRDFEVEIVNMADKSAEFTELSPTGSPPLIVVDGVAIFETAVIIEYIDEIFPPHGQYRFYDPVLRSRNRSWILFGLDLLMKSFAAIMARDKDSYESKFDSARKHLTQLERELGDGPFFNGESASLIDFVYATFFLRQELFDRSFGVGLLDDFPKASRWSKQLLARPSTRDSLPEDFETTLISWLRGSGSFVANRA